MCNADQPLGRTFNGIFALQYSSPNPTGNTGDYDGNILRWGANYAMANIDEADGRCGNGTTKGTTAHTQYGAIIDNSILYFGSEPCERSGVVA